MFEIEYKGGNSVIISTKDRQLVVDPNVSMLGLKMSKLSNAVQIATEEDFLFDIGDDNVTLDGAGEYEAEPFAIKGTAVRRHIDTENDGNKGTIYRVEVLGTRIGILGNVQSKLSDDELEALGVVDILIIPVGGNGYTLDAKDAAIIVGRVEPKLVIPTHYSDPAIKYEVPQEQVDLFVKELGAPVEYESKLKFKSVASLPAVLTTYVLNRS